MCYISTLYSRSLSGLCVQEEAGVFVDRLLGGVTQVVVIQYYFCVRLALAAAQPHTTHTHTRGR